MRVSVYVLCATADGSKPVTRRYAHRSARPRWAWPLTPCCRTAGRRADVTAEGGKAGRRGTRPRKETYAYRHIPEVKGHSRVHVHRVGNGDSSHSHLIGQYIDTVMKYICWWCNSEKLRSRLRGQENVCLFPNHVKTHVQDVTTTISPKL